MAIRDEIRALIERGNVTYEEIYNLKVMSEELTALLPVLTTIAFLCVLQVQSETPQLKESVDTWDELQKRYRIDTALLLNRDRLCDSMMTRITALEVALAPLVRIADAYDENNLDDEARKHWGKDLEHTNTTPPEDIELYDGRGGKQLLTLADCFKARDAYKASK